MTVRRSNFKPTDTALGHACEACDQVLESEEPHRSGCDYPPETGFWRVVSLRTCDQCPMSGTLSVDYPDRRLRWTVSGTAIEANQAALRRIISEPPPPFGWTARSAKAWRA